MSGTRNLVHYKFRQQFPERCLVIPCNGKLQNAGDGDPDQVGDLCKRDPAVMRPDGFHGPKDSEPDDGDVEGSKWEIAEPEQDRRESDVSEQVDGKGDCDGPS